MANSTIINSETNEAHFIEILKDIYKENLHILGRVSIVDNTNKIFKTTRLLTIPYVEYCSHNFELYMRNVIGKQNHKTIL